MDLFGIGTAPSGSAGLAVSHRRSTTARTATGPTSCNCSRTCTRNSCGSPAAIISKATPSDQRFDWKKTIGDISQRPGHRSPLGLLVHGRHRPAGISRMVRRPAHGTAAGRLCRLFAAPASMSRPGRTWSLTCRTRSTKLNTSPATPTRPGARNARRTGIPRRSRCTTSRSATKTGSTVPAVTTGGSRSSYDAIKAKYPQPANHRHHPGQRAARRIWLTNIITGRRRKWRRSRTMYDTRSRDGQDEDLRRRMGHARRLAHAQHGRRARRRRVDDWHGTQFRPRPHVLLRAAVRQRQRPRPGRSMQWSTDLIGYDALNSYGSPAYYAQKMFSTHHGDEVLATDSQDIPTYPWQPPRAPSQRRDPAASAASNRCRHFSSTPPATARAELILPESRQPPRHGAAGEN